MRPPRAPIFEPSPDRRGFVFATTGYEYTTLARRAARSLKQVMPDAAVDLFTDQTVMDPIFDRIHDVRAGYFRPKTEAMQNTRFDRTVILDADCMVLAPLNEIFDVLDRVDIAGACASARASNRRNAAVQVPRAVSLINSGVLAVRGTPKMRAFAAAWEAAIIRENVTRDQGVLRRLLWTRNVSFLPLGNEYNLKQLGLLWEWPKEWGAPRILHQSRLHQKAPGDPNTPFELDELLSKPLADHVRALLAADWSLGGDTALEAPPPGPRARSKRYQASLSDVPNRAFAAELLRRIRGKLGLRRPRA